MNFVAGLSKQTFAPTHFISSFQNSTPNRDAVQTQLIGAGIAPKIDSETSPGNSSISTLITPQSPDAGAVLDGSFLTSLLSSFTTISNVVVSHERNSVSDAGAATGRQVGAFCREDGTLVFSGSEVAGTPSALLGEGEGDDSLIPQVQAPSLASAQFASNLASFVPASQSSSSTLSVFGAFTAASLTNPDTLLPGLNWAFQTDSQWTDPNSWSFTEKLVLAFNLDNSDLGDWDETRINGNDGDEEIDDSSMHGLDGHSNGESDANATRYGYFFYTYHATMGIAGVSWSLTVSYSDSVTLGATASGGSTYTPTTAPVNPSSGHNSWIYGVQPGEQPTYPSDYQATSNWNAAINFSVASSGNISISSTPVLTSSGAVQRTLNASIDYNAGGHGSASADWSSASQSGAIVLPNHPAGPGGDPLSGCVVCIFGSGSSSETANDWITTNPNDETDIEIDPAPVGEIEGTGHASSSSGKSLSAGSGNSTGAFTLNAH